MKNAKDYGLPIRILRTCDMCIHEDDFDCDVRHERLVNCLGYLDHAPNCPHFVRDPKRDSNN